jgi:predicted cytidylate kinase
MIITISGDAGSGKNTVGEILSKKLNMKLYCMGDLRRKMAEKRGMTIGQFNKLGEKQSFTDAKVDKFQEELGKKEDNFIMVGRVSFHFIPNSKKIYLAVKPEIGAKRIMGDKSRKTEKYATLKGALEKLRERKRCDIMRYKKYYDIDDAYSHKYYDLIVDTSSLSPRQIADRIIKFVKR